jgi:hypothetical protein
MIVNISAIPAYILSVLSVCILYLYSTYRLQVDIVVVALYCGGALLEVLAEPFYNIYYSKLYLIPRMRAETIAVTARSLVTFFFVVVLGSGVRGFGAAQLAYGLSYYAVMMWHASFISINGARTSLSSFAGSFRGGLALLLNFRQSCQNPLIKLAIYATGTSLLKHLLTEGDKIVLSITTSHFHQGIYAITCNYGSLVARILFQPIEESSRLAFARMVAAAGDEFSLAVNKFSIFSSEASLKLLSLGDASSIQTRLRVLKEMSGLLSGLLGGIALFAAVFPVLGAFYSRAIIKLFLGQKWYLEETVSTLSAFCFYLYVLAINGISESFVHAVMSPTSMAMYNVALVVSWIAFVSAAAVLMKWNGTAGIVQANILGMTIRSAFNLYFAQCFFSVLSSLPVGHPVSKQKTKKKGEVCPVAMETASSGLSFCSFAHIFPPIRICLVCVAIAIIAYSSSCRFASSEMAATDFFFHIFVGILCGVVYLLACWHICRDRLKKLYTDIRHQKLD